jgi:hypothetical protein
MEPISVWVKKNNEWAIIHRCKSCGKMSANRIAADDNPMKLMSIALKPFAHAKISTEKLKKAEKTMNE